MQSRQIATLTRDDSQAPMLLGLGGSILFLAILLLGARLWSRLRPISNLKADDWTALVATILATLHFSVQCAACSYGFGRRTPFVSLENRTKGLRLLFTAQVIWYWSITFTKLSVALLLLRLKPDRRWKIFLYSIMTIVVLTVVVQTCFQFLQCRPFSVYWDRTLREKNVVVKCIPVRLITANIYFNSTINVTTDFIFSLIPITFIRKLHRPRSEKIFLSILMGLGLFTSTFAILRTLTLNDLPSGDFYRQNVILILWATLEQEFALVAATIPTLRSFMRKSLIQLGYYFYDQESETQIRGRLVQMGFLASTTEDERYAMCKQGEKSGDQVATFGSPKREKKEEFIDSVDSFAGDVGMLRVGTVGLEKI